MKHYSLPDFSITTKGNHVHNVTEGDMQSQMGVAGNLQEQGDKALEQEDRAQ